MRLRVEGRTARENLPVVEETAVADDPAHAAQDVATAGPPGALRHGNQEPAHQGADVWAAAVGREPAHGLRHDHAAPAVATLGVPVPQRARRRLAPRAER
eukprot:9309743-Pyramimonas_sp.AAC.1